MRTKVLLNPIRRSSGTSVAGALGFTLIELIMVLVLVSALAVFVAPRLSAGDFYAIGFHNQTQAYLRYAQKTAIAQRRTVCVTFTSNNMVTLKMASAPGTFDCASETSPVLKGPGGESPAVLTARSGVGYVSPPSSFNFDALGQPITSAGLAQGTQTFQVANASRSLIIETATGYVHE